MKQFFISFILLASCIPQPIVQAPQMIVVEAVSPVSLDTYTAEPQADKITVIKWAVNPIIPSEENSESYFDDSFTGTASFIYQRGIYRATFVINGDKLEYVCGEDKTRLLSCDAEMEIQNLSCGNDMIFSVVCKKETVEQ